MLCKILNRNPLEVQKFSNLGKFDVENEPRVQLISTLLSYRNYEGVRIVESCRNRKEMGRYSLILESIFDVIIDLCEKAYAPG